MSRGSGLAPSILREYDIRGTVGETLDTADAATIGRAFANVVTEAGEGRRVCVGFDGRLSSPTLEAALVDGLRAGGMEVLRIGLGPTPLLYFATHRLAANGGIMITGSHNPPEYNGFKLMLGSASFFGDDIQRLGEIAAHGDFVTGSGTAAEVNVQDDYVAFLAETGAGAAALKVAWDTGNGAAGDVVQQLTKRIPGTHVLLNAEIDGTFPAHHPDPTVPKNLAQLIETVRAEACDLGFAFDGDGDRIGLVDGEGCILWGDQILALLARDVLRERPGATIIADVKASQVLFDEVARLGGKPLMWRTGHSLIKAKMAELGAPLAGEMSGHIFFADRYYGFDDALYAALRMLLTLTREGQSLAALRRSLPRRVNTPELRFDCADAQKFGVVDQVRARLAGGDAKVNGIDGVRVQTEDGWWLLRASNTQPVLVARCEADDEAGLARQKQALRDQLEASGLDLPDF